MPYVTCPTCGERGKIPSSLIGARIKCRTCGLSFQVAPPSTKAVGAGATAAAAAATTGPTAAVEMQGIEVEGMDASAWAVPTETAMTLKITEAEQAGGTHEPLAGFAPAQSSPAGGREYKLLTSRDKCFEGRFDLPRLEEAINLHARQGWAVKALSVPHLKGFSGTLEEVIVVLLERCTAGT